MSEPRLSLARKSLPKYADQFAELASWIAAVAPEGARLLDIGAGDGDDEYFGLIRPLAAEIVGVDRDPGLERNERLDGRYAMTVERFATLVGRGEVRRFDIALAIYVAEHVEHPVAFLRAAASCLLPGGSLFLVTPNLWHYFGIAAKGATALGVDDLLLELLRRSHPDHGHVAHFGVSYRMNSVGALARAAAEAGFAVGEIRHLENPGIFEGYFHPSLVSLPRAYSDAIHRLGRGELYGTIICRLVTPASGTGAASG